MTDTPELDRAIRAYNKAYDVPDDWPIRDVDREAFRAGVAELLRDAPSDEANPFQARSETQSYRFIAGFAEIKRRAGLEGEG